MSVFSEAGIASSSHRVRPPGKGRGCPPQAPWPPASPAKPRVMSTVNKEQTPLRMQLSASQGPLQPPRGQVLTQLLSFPATGPPASHWPHLRPTATATPDLGHPSTMQLQPLSVCPPHRTPAPAPSLCSSGAQPRDPTFSSAYPPPLKGSPATAPREGLRPSRPGPSSSKPQTAASILQVG